MKLPSMGDKQAFLFIFPAVLAGLFILFNVLPEDILFKPLIEITGEAAIAFSKLLGVSAIWLNDNWTIGVLTVAGFKMMINIECTAVHFMFIFIAAVVASPGKSFRDKGIALVAGLSILFVVNLLRIVMAGVAGSISYSTFEITHNFIWKGLYILLTFFIWHAWIKNMRFMNFSLRDISLTAFVILLTYSIVDFLTYYYTTLLYLIVSYPINTVLDLGVYITQHTEHLTFYIDQNSKGKELLGMPTMFMESILFYVLATLTIIREKRKHFLRPLGLCFLAMLGAHVFIIILVAAIYPLATINKGSTLLTLKALAITLSYLLWYGVFHDRKIKTNTPSENPD
jgi:exosortase/archaeosortase family protein